MDSEGVNKMKKHLSSFCMLFVLAIVLSGWSAANTASALPRYGGWGIEKTAAAKALPRYGGWGIEKTAAAKALPRYGGWA